MSPTLVALNAAIDQLPPDVDQDARAYLRDLIAAFSAEQIVEGIEFGKRMGRDAMRAAYERERL